MNTLVELSKLFSDKNRLHILALIQKHQEVCVCEICDTLKLSQPLVSRHLKLMKEANILEARKDKKWVHYAITKTPHSFLSSMLKELQKDENLLPTLITCKVK